MILQASQTIIEFNGGDICVGYREKDGIGEIGFRDIEQTEIGQEIEGEDDIFPVRLIFKKIESVDVIIKQLQNMKNKMKERKEK